MNNFTGVGKASFNYRIFPRLMGVVVMTIVILVFSLAILGFIKINNYVLISLGISLVFLLIFGLITYLTAYLEYSNLKYMIEENSLLLKEGVFNVDTETIPFEKIRNASITQNIIQRVFGVGNVVIDQEPEKYVWSSIDNKSAQIIIEAVSEKSNIQPIQVAEGQANPYQAKQ